MTQEKIEELDNKNTNKVVIKRKNYKMPSNTNYVPYEEFLTTVCKHANMSLQQGKDFIKSMQVALQQIPDDFFVKTPIGTFKMVIHKPKSYQLPYEKERKMTDTYVDLEFRPIKHFKRKIRPQNPNILTDAERLKRKGR